jgi:hypothetical protein
LEFKYRSNDAELLLSEKKNKHELEQIQPTPAYSANSREELKYGADTSNYR